MVPAKPPTIVFCTPDVIFSPLEKPNALLYRDPDPLAFLNEDQPIATFLPAVVAVDKAL